MARRRRRRPHGLGSVYQRGPGNWWIKWRESGRYRYAHGYATRELADQVLAKVVADIAGAGPGCRATRRACRAFRCWRRSGWPGGSTPTEHGATTATAGGDTWSHSWVAAGPRRWTQA
jgi:hypothetical protein